MKHVIAVLFKYPVPGTVKTRLAVDLGPEAAAAAYEQLAAQTLASLPSDSAEIWISFTPAHLEAEVQSWILENMLRKFPVRFIAQPTGDLGARLWHIVELALAVEGASSVTLIGTDCPYLQATHFHQAWESLGQGSHVVFGPTADGGYYLQSLRTARREIFTDIPWSQPTTLAACESRCAEIGLTCQRLAELEDVDDLPAWNRWLGV